jgi:organic hydroperoxide reductase OsmC/OhrA
MLWYLHYASDAGIVVTGYSDAPLGVGEVLRGGAGRFVKVTLRPHVVLAAGSDLAQAEAVHHRIHEVCFIARSVNFPVYLSPSFAIFD